MAQTPVIWRVVKVVAVCLILGTGILVGSGWLLLSVQSPLNRASAIKTTCEWTRLAPFPKTASDFRIETAGSMFTREFLVTFSAPEADLQIWLQNSPGPREAVIEPQENGDILYKITPGDGAQFAEMILSKDKRSVSIRCYWS